MSDYISFSLKKDEEILMEKEPGAVFETHL